jgi:mannitol/fructose-specific phosphotransferase system IIA component (Ntr-type)
MKITDILSKDCILDDLKSKSKKDVIVEMVGILLLFFPVKTYQQVFIL